MGNEESKSSKKNASQGQRQPSAPQKTLSHEPNIAELDPKIKKWLIEGPPYTSTSVPKNESANLSPQQEKNNDTIESTLGILKVATLSKEEPMDPDILAIKSLPNPRPIFYTRRSKEFFPHNIDGAKEILKLNHFALLNLFLFYQNKLNNVSADILLRQDALRKRVELLTKKSVTALQQIGSLGNVVTTFEQQLFEFLNMSRILEECNTKLRRCLMRTQQVLAFLDEKDRTDIEFPLQILAPFLILDYYASFNHLRKSRQFREWNDVSQAARATEEYWIDHILPYIDSLRSLTTLKQKCREGIPPKFRAAVWRRLVPNHLNLTPEFYFELCSSVRARLSEDVEVQVKKEPFKVLLEQSQKQGKDFNDNEDKNSRAHETITAASPSELVDKNIRQLQETLSTPPRPWKQQLRTYHPTQKKRPLLEVQMIITNDIHRTFPEHGIYNDTNSKEYNELLNVLLTFACFRPDIGYIQGMSYIAALLLQYLSEADSFIVFANLLTSHFFSAFLRLDYDEVMKHFKIFEILFAQQLPNLYKTFHQKKIALEHFLLEWFITAFTRSFPISVSSRIWDCFLVEGEIFLHVAAVALLKYYEIQLENSAFDNCLAILSSNAQEVDVSKLFQIIQQIEVPFYLYGFVEELQRQS
jgi:hypothetical protein